MNRSAICTIMCLIVLLALLPLSGFADTESGQQKILMAEMPLYLEEHLDAARIVGSEVPEDVPEPVEWRFDEPQPDWKPAPPWNPSIEPAQLTPTDDALRVTLTDGARNPRGQPVGGIYTDLPGWRHHDWGYALVRARTSAGEAIQRIFLSFNLREGSGTTTDYPNPFRFHINQIDVVNQDGIQTYRHSLDSDSMRNYEEPLQQFGLWFGSSNPVSLDILSVSLIRKETYYADAPVGIRDEVRNEERRRTVFTHAPGRLEYRLHMPDAARLDIGLGVLKENNPVAFKITAKPDSGDTTTVLEETYADEKHWAQRRIDLSDFSGRMVTLSFEADAESAGTVAFWAAPTVSGNKRTERPPTSTLIWDTQSHFVDEIDLRDRDHWQVISAPPIGWGPSSRGRRYFFEGDAVIENEHLVAVFWSEKGRVVIYSKGDLGEKRVVFVPLQLKRGLEFITDCRILQNTGDEAALKVSFSGTGKGEEVSALVSFSKNKVVEIKPAENMKGIRLLSSIAYGVVPDFITDDLIFDPKEYPAKDILHIPSENLFLGLLKGRNHMLVVTWPQGKQQMRLVQGDSQADPRLFETVDFDNDGKSIYLALLHAPGIWHKEVLKPSYLEKDIAINWKRPFPAKWITQLREAGVRTTYRFHESRGPNIIREVANGRYFYPVWFEGETPYYRLGKKIPPKGESLIYFLERKRTPGTVSTPVDVVKETLGRQVCDTILDVPGRELSTHHRRPRPGETIVNASTCIINHTVLKPIFEAGQEVEKKELIHENADDLVFFVTRIRERIDQYLEFAYELAEFINLKRKSNPDLKVFLDNMEAITEEIFQEYDNVKEHIRTLDYVNELGHRTKALAQKRDPKNLATFSGLSYEWRWMGGHQDELLAKFHSITRKLFQEAGYGCVNNPEAIAIGKEIRRRCRECLRNPDGYEIWADY